MESKGGIRWTYGRHVVAGLALASLAAFSSCSGADSDEIVDLTTAPVSAESTVAATAPTTTEPPPTTTTATTPSTTANSIATPTSTVDDSPAEALEAELLRVLVGARDAFLASVANPIDVSAERLEPWVTSARLADLRVVLERRAGLGTATRRGSSEALSIMAFEPVGDDVYVVVTCVTTDSVVYEVDTGEIVDDDLGYITSSATIVREDGILRVSGTTRLTLSLDVPCE